MRSADLDREVRRAFWRMVGTIAGIVVVLVAVSIGVIFAVVRVVRWAWGQP